MAFWTSSTVGAPATSGTALGIRLAEQTVERARAANVPAGAIVVFTDGKRAAHRVWGPGVTRQTPFRWGSITKSFTALAVLDLIEHTNLTLQTPVDEFLSEMAFTNPWADRDPLRVVHLIELTAGLSDLSGIEFESAAPMSLSTALKLNPTSRQLRWPPGLQHSYTNVAPGLSALLIEQVSGTGFETYLDERVFTPLQMTGASLQPVAGLPGGFKADGHTEIPYWHMTFRGFGALNASSNALAGFVETLLNKDTQTLLPPTRLAAMLQPSSGPAAVTGLTVGYGAGAYGRVRNGSVFYGHGGDADGYRSRYAVDPVSGRGYLIVINTDNPGLLRRLVANLETELAHGATKRQPAPARSVASAELAALQGTYYPSAARFGVEDWQKGDGRRAQVTFHRNTLVLQQGNVRTQLIALGGGRFRRRNDPLTTAVFFNHLGALYLQGELGNYVRIKPGTCPDFLAWCHPP